jgi:hypothetical protein
MRHPRCRQGSATIGVRPRHARRPARPTDQI